MPSEAAMAWSRSVVCSLQFAARSSVLRRNFCVLHVLRENTCHANTIGSAKCFVRPIATEPNVEVTLPELKKMITEGNIQLLDVREPHELLQYGRIPTSTNIPLPQVAEALTMDPEDFKEKYGTDMPENDGGRIVFHCKAGMRSHAAMQAAHQIGYSKARHFPGGFDEWEKSNS